MKNSVHAYSYQQPVRLDERIPISEIEEIYPVNTLTANSNGLVIIDEAGNLYDNLEAAKNATLLPDPHTYEPNSIELLPETAELKVIYEGLSGSEQRQIALIFSGSYTLFNEYRDNGTFCVRYRRRLRKGIATITVSEIADCWRDRRIIIRYGTPTARVIEYKPEGKL